MSDAAIPAPGTAHGGHGQVSVVISTFACLVLALAVSFAIGLGNVAWFELVNGRLDVEGPIARALVFSSFLVVIGGAVVVREPASFGFRRGSIREHWRFVAGIVAGAMVFTAIALRSFGGTPYSDASWIVECVIVPFTEELVFRAAMLTLLIAYLVRIHPRRAAVGLAVAIDAVGFGLAHATNLTSMSASFVLPQVAFAVIVGLACAAVMARTRSVYPAMVVHAAVNAVVVLS